MQSITIRTDNIAFRTSEAYKTLRSNIEFSGKDKRVITITSCTPNEGKSEVSFELARSFAQNNKKVLLIDADLRKSVMREHFQAGVVRYGLSNYLVGQCEFDECLCETDAENFYMIFAGPSTPIPSELLASDLFREMLDLVRKDFDYVIIDTPPLGSVVDSAIVGRETDGVVLVISHGAISYRFAQSVANQLQRAECHILGAVLNKVPMSGGKGYGKNYGKYYGKYYGNYYGNYGDEK